jgi:hypothetical protein
MTEWDLAYMRRRVQPTDADLDRIADAVPIDNFEARATTWHRRFARAVLAAQPLHEQLREMGEAHAAQPAPVPERWVVVCETILDVGHGKDVRTGGKPELGYALLSHAVTFPDEDAARAAHRSADLPLGWVIMPLSRLLPDLPAAPVPDIVNPKCPDCGHRALGVGCDMRVPHRAAQPAPVPKPVPVAWLKTMYSGTRPMLEVDHLRKYTSMPVYTHPAAPVPVPLTDEQIAHAWISIKDPIGLGGKFETPAQVRDFARAIERAHGIAASPEVP